MIRIKRTGNHDFILSVASNVNFVAKNISPGRLFTEAFPIIKLVTFKPLKKTF